MKITFLGTGGSEGVPGLFCSCPVCMKARRAKGKEVRTRMGVMVNDDLMIDFSPDTNTNVMKNDIHLPAVKYLLFTHSHEDHFYIDDLCQRNEYNLNMEQVEPLQIYANQAVINTCEQMFTKSQCRGTIRTMVVTPEVPLFVGDYKITPFKSRHINTFHEDSLIYLIQQNGKGYLHLVDSGEIFPEVYAYLEKNKIIVEAIAVDCTYSLLKERYFGHLNLEQVQETCEKLKEIGVIASHTKVYATHIAHFASHEDIEKACEGTGIKPAYDGLQITI